MHGESCFLHVEAGGFDTACGVSSGDIEFMNIMIPDEFSKRFTGQRAGLRLDKNTI